MRWLRERWAEWNAPSYPVRGSVIVNTLSDKAFRGVLWMKTAEFLVLRNAELYFAPDRQWKPVDGEVVIERLEVEFLQVLSGARA